eukprot:6237331-Heterocapsa_arctica.AAC.1
MESEIGLDKWVQNAVELSRFFKGGPLDNITGSAQKTVDRIKLFISPEHQTPGQAWMANCTTAPFKRAPEAYTAYLIANGLSLSTVNDNR